MLLYGPIYCYGILIKNASNSESQKLSLITLDTRSTMHNARLKKGTAQCFRVDNSARTFINLSGTTVHCTNSYLSLFLSVPTFISYTPYLSLV